MELSLMTDNTIVDKNGFTIKPGISNRECILLCLRNAPCGLNKKQIDYLIKKFENE